MLNTPTENYVSTIRKKIGNDLLILVGSNVIIENELDQVSLLLPIIHLAIPMFLKTVFEATLDIVHFQ